VAIKYWEGDESEFHQLSHLHNINLNWPMNINTSPVLSFSR
jgi:hypothetical protein